MTTPEAPQTHLGEFDFFDLFAGIGGFHQAMALLGGTCTLAAEIDDDARKTYVANFGEPKYGLVRDIADFTSDRQRMASVPAPTVLCAGFPCQPFSKSGAQQGLRDKTRGTLFFEIMEIVRQHHPRYLILENVKNLAGPRHIDTWQTIISSLREERYRVCDDPVIASPHVLPHEGPGEEIPGGRPQVRERVFILAQYMGDDAAPEDLVMHPSDLGLDLVLSSYGHRRFWRLVPPDGLDLDAYWSIEDWLEEDTRAIEDEYGLSDDQRHWIEAWQDFIDHVQFPPRLNPGGEPTGTRLTGFPIWADSLREDALEQIDAETPDWKVGHITKNHRLYMLTNGSGRYVNREFIDAWKARHDIDSFPLSRRKFEWQSQGERDLSKLVLQMRPSGIRVKRATYLPALVAITQTSILGSRQRTLTPNEAARLQGFDAPEKFKVHANAAAAFKQLGNAVNVGIVVHMARALFAAHERYVQDGQEPALRAS